MFERQRLLPSPDSEGLSEQDRLYAAYYTDDPVVALISSMAGELPDERYSTPLQGVADDLAASPYLRTLLDFATWARDGVPLTATGNLRVAPAREAYDALGLEQWARDLARLQYDIDPPLPGPAAMGMEAWIEQQVARDRPTRSAGDSVGLERLLAGGGAAGLLVDEGRRIVGRPVEEEPTAKGWRDLGIRAAIGVFEWLRERELSTAIVTQAILRSLVHGRRPVSLEEMDRFCQAWLTPPEDRRMSGADGALRRTHRRGRVNAALGLVADLGILVLDHDSVRLTDAGDDFFWTWWDFLEEQAPRA
ncbi:hypothetical protein [Nocardioides sp. TF02-7]|uniref:hypothetical protein n=1 Tax=Nocardioides sp. TF02-7 TaxID=2917724 RepID=UPI001F06B969|nr:hypothetical protein [Nocardioides sp. TF02-7]UMG93563.1 hypothetical protein MF408_05060 [Nocardioides sp. TF02-7]